MVGVKLGSLADSETAEKAIDHVLDGNRSDGPCVIGTSLWHATLVPTTGPGGEPIISGVLTSVHPHSNLYASVAHAETRFRTLVQHSSDLIGVVSLTKEVVYVSPAVEVLLGYRAREVIGEPVTRVVHPRDMATVERVLEESVSGTGRDGEPFDVRLRHRDGTWRIFELVGTNLFGDAEIRGAVLNGRDVTEHRQETDELRYRATHDPLTDLLNRAQFLVDLQAQLERGTSEQLAVIVVGLDRFKVVNDSLGHAAGDEVLIAAARRLSQALQHGLVARLGGDTFVVTEPTLTGARHARVLAQRLLAALHDVIDVDGHHIMINARAGIALNSPGDTATDLVREADAALHEAKARHETPIVLFDSILKERTEGQLRREQALHDAARNNELRLHFQPIVSLDTAATVAVEALVRWQHPEVGLVAPADFIALAEETGDIVAIGAWVLTEACRIVSEWNRRGNSLPVSINVSPRQLLGDDFLYLVRETLARTGMPASLLTLEVTESVLLEDRREAQHTLSQLRQMGVRLAIDDFGTGYSSLLHLRRLDAATLKIDRSFVDDFGRDEDDTTIVQTVIALAKSLRLEVVAEGVETDWQRRLLLDHGCQYAQGFLFSRPVPFEQLALGSGRGGNS